MQWNEQNLLITSRAATGIYLILDCLPYRGSVVVPANLCYAGIYPVLYAGDRPSFCDVDSVTGNVTWNAFRSALSDDVIAAIIPHMYGLPVKDMPRIAAYCREHHILLIEDCASAMGATSDYPVGNMGDYAIYSTGYSKTLDLGFGGLIYSTRYSLDSMREKESELPFPEKEDEMDLRLFSKLYRLLRNEGHGGKLETSIYTVLPEACKTGFLHQISAKQKKVIVKGLKSLPECIAARKEGEQQYREALRDVYSEEIKPYPYQEGSVPWRFNLMLVPQKHRYFIDRCLQKNLPVSDWYPCTASMFADQGEYPGAYWHERSIVNFPLPLSKDKIEWICTQIKEIVTDAAF